MSYLLITYHWRHLTRPQLADFKCPVTPLPLKETEVHLGRKQKGEQTTQIKDTVI